MVKLSNFPIISFGLVKIEFRSKNFKLRKTSDPITIKTESARIFAPTLAKLPSLDSGKGVGASGQPRDRCSARGPVEWQSCSVHQ